jgi:hypothetical protein
MISNTDSTPLIYSTEHILVKVYKGRGSRQRFQSACGDAPSDAYLAGAIQSAARSGRFSVEAGTRSAAPVPAPLSPLAASFLRCAPDRFHLTKPNTFQHNREASVATLRWCSGSSRNAVRLPFGTGVQLRRNPHPPFASHMASSLYAKQIVVSFGRQQIEQPATARGKARHVPAPVWSPGVRVESRRLKSRPVASGGYDRAFDRGIYWGISNS